MHPLVRLLCWNVNSLHIRFERLVGVLQRHDPDVVCLQETKMDDERFPAVPLRQRGYHVAHRGQKAYNGVAILSKAPLHDVRTGFDGDPVPHEARTMAATVAGLRIWDLYVVNGQAVGTDKFERKMVWLDGVRRAILEEAASRPLVAVGDWNIAPTDLDVHDPEQWRGRVHATPEEREHLRRLEAAGLTDLQRLHDDGPGPWTWWDYRGGAFRHGWGLRIDLAYGSAAVAQACTAVTVDKDERRQPTHPSKPSDHAPVIVDLDWPFEPDPPAAPKPTRATTLGSFG